MKDKCTHYLNEEQPTSGELSYIREQQPTGATSYNSQLYAGVMQTLQTGTVKTKNSFIAATTEESQNNFFRHTWTWRKLRLFFSLNKRLPTNRKKVKDFRNNLTAVDLYNIDRSGGDALNHLTQVFVPWIDLSNDVDEENGARLVKETKKELAEIAAIRTEWYFNTIIGDTNLQLTRTGPLLNIEEGTIMAERNGEIRTVEGAYIVYNNLWLYGNRWAWVPPNMDKLLADYGNDTPIFPRMLLHFIGRRFPKTSGENIKAQVERKKRTMKKHYTGKEYWKGYIADTVNKVTSDIYTQDGLLNLLDDYNKDRYFRARTIKGKVISVSEDDEKKYKYCHTYTSMFRTDRFLDHVQRSVEACVKIGVLTKARVFIIPKKEPERQALVKDLCKQFPGLGRRIETLTHADGVCCCVTYNREWGTSFDGIPYSTAVQVDDITNTTTTANTSADVPEVSEFNNI